MFFHASQYIKYKIFSWHKYGHGIHSPFIYKLVREVFMQTTTNDILKEIEKERKHLQKNKEYIQKTDFGIGKKKRGALYKRKISDIARTNLLPQKHAKLLHRICTNLDIKTAIELGTSFGITTAYLAKGSSKVVTFEGCPATMDVAKQTASKLGIKNIEFILGEFSDSLDKHLPSKIDFAYIDGNHTKEATLKYTKKLLPCIHKNSIIIFNDIYLTQEMQQAWKEIISWEEITLSVDIFELGIIFFREGVRKQNFKIRY